MKTKKLFRNIAVISGVILFMWFWLPSMVGIFHIGNVTGMVCSVILIILGIFRRQAGKFLTYAKKHLWAKIAVGAVTAFVCAVGIAVILLTAGMIYSANKIPPENTTAIVLGCKVNGTVPSRMLRGRLERAVSYLNENPDARCVVTGGQGKGEDISEGEAMAEYLIGKGISPERIYIESLSTDTEENISFSKEIMEREGLGTEAVIISDGFHVFRGTIIAEKQGLEAYGAGAFTDIFLFPCYYVRELYGLIEEIVLK